jgi:hypothetical protein
MYFTRQEIKDEVLQDNGQVPVSQSPNRPREIPRHWQERELEDAGSTALEAIRVPVSADH